MEQQYQTTPRQEEQEFSLKELIAKLEDFYHEILQSWKLIALLVILFVAALLFRAIKTPITFPAKLSFMINEDDNGGALAGVGGLLGSFGLGGGASDYNLEKLLELSRTLKITKESLFEKITIKGKEDYYANHLIKLYDFHDKWKEDSTGLKNFYFSHKDFQKFQRFENKALKNIYMKVVGNPKKGIEALLSSNISEETGIMSLTVASESEALSIQFVQTIYEKLSKFYVDKTIEKQKSTHDIVKEKVDSIKAVLQSTEYALADFKDSNLGLISKKAKLKELQLEAKISILYSMLGEAIKNLEVAEFSLKNKTPFVQIIDAPFPPIQPQGESKLKAIIIGGFLGGFLSIAFIIIRKLYRDALVE